MIQGTPTGGINRKMGSQI